MAFTMIFLLFEIPNQLKMFDFFSAFVRALNETAKDSAQIGAVFLIIVVMQAFMIWVVSPAEEFVGISGLT